MINKYSRINKHGHLHHAHVYTHGAMSLSLANIHLTTISIKKPFNLIAEGLSKTKNSPCWTDFATGSIQEKQTFSMNFPIH